MGNRRRKKNEYLLDVKVHTEGRTRAQVKWLTAVVVTLGVLSLTCYGLYRGLKWGAAKLVFENPRFAIAQITVENDGVLTHEQILQLAGVRVGQNLLALDLDDVRRTLESIPMIQRVEVRRQMPQRLFIHVNERVAVARMRAPRGTTPDDVYWIDRRGVAMQAIKLSNGTRLQPQTIGAAPLLTGVTLPNLRPGQAIESDLVFTSLELLDRVAQSVAGRMMEIEQVDLSRPRQLTLVTKQKTQVKFDVEDFPQQLRRLGSILVWANQRQKTVQAVDLTVSRGVPVAFAN